MQQVRPPMHVPSLKLGLACHPGQPCCRGWLLQSKLRNIVRAWAAGTCLQIQHCILSPASGGPPGHRELGPCRQNSVFRPVLCRWVRQRWCKFWPRRHCRSSRPHWGLRRSAARAQWLSACSAAALATPCLPAPLPQARSCLCRGPDCMRNELWRLPARMPFSHRQAAAPAGGSTSAGNAVSACSAPALLCMAPP